MTTYQLMKASEYRERRFIGTKKPALNTIKRWIRDGILPGEILGGCYYVHVDSMGHPVKPSHGVPPVDSIAAKTAALSSSTGNELADQLLQGWIAKSAA